MKITDASSHAQNDIVKKPEQKTHLNYSDKFNEPSLQPSFKKQLDFDEFMALPDDVSEKLTSSLNTREERKDRELFNPLPETKFSITNPTNLYEDIEKYSNIKNPNVHKKISLSHEAQDLSKLYKKKSKLLTINIKRPLSSITTLKKITSSHKTKSSNLSNGTKTVVIINTNPLTDSLNTSSKHVRSSENFCFVQVIHNGLLEFATKINSVRVEDRFGAVKTIVTVKIPKKLKCLDDFYERILDHLCIKESLDSE